MHLENVHLRNLCYVCNVSLVFARFDYRFFLTVLQHLFQILMLWKTGFDKSQNKDRSLIKK